MSGDRLKPCIGLVQGDVCGIGPEVMSKLLQIDEVRSRARILIMSDKRAFRAGETLTGHRAEVREITRSENADFSDGLPNLLDTRVIDPVEVTPGQVSKKAGAAVLQDFGLALDLAQAGTIGGICFMPFNKEAMHLAGIGVGDELIWAKQRLGHKGRASEFNVIDGMWNGRVTSHVPLKDVSGLLDVNVIVEAIGLADRTLKGAGYGRPRIAVAALNPHAGDGGALGREEIDIIRPAVAKAKAMGIDVQGPFPSDTMYIKVRDGRYDCAISMYHDQGQIAIKLLGFDMGVSVLGGLPIPITTPAHGTAFDIVGTNTANVSASLRAFTMVAEMAENRMRSGT